MLLVVSFLAIGALTLLGCSAQPLPERDRPATLYAPDDEGDYWDDERIGSVAPAPMPQA